MTHVSVKEEVLRLQLGYVSEGPGLSSKYISFSRDAERIVAMVCLLGLRASSLSRAPFLGMTPNNPKP